MKATIKIILTIIITIVLMVVSYAAISHFSSKYTDSNATISVLVVSIIAAIGVLTVVSTLYDLHHQKKADRKIPLIENEDNHPLAAFRYCPVCGSSKFIAKQDNAKTCEDCGFNYYINPSAAVAAFIINKEEELLVGRRAYDPAKGTLDLPGGFVILEETGEEAVKRELKEELNLTVTKAKMLFTIPNKYRWSDMTIPTLDLFYQCEVADIDQLQPLDDVVETFFIKLDYIHPEDFGLESIRQAVTLFQEGKMSFTS